MKDTRVFFNPFRLISPKLDSEANRLEEMLDTPPKEVTHLEEGLLVMMGKIIEMTQILSQILFIPDQEKMATAERLGKEIHEEEKILTGNVVLGSLDVTPSEVLKAVVLFPGHLERVGDHLESILNCCRIKDREGILFVDKSNQELAGLFGLLIEILTNFRDVLITRNRALLEIIGDQDLRLGQMILDFQAAYEDRLLEGLCPPRSASIIMDILDSIKYANTHIRDMGDILLRLDEKQA
jgi:Na+/phosphate symporter